jgi:integrase
MYSVSEYLAMLKLSKRSPATLKSYTMVFTSYAKFLNVQLGEVHNHLSPENLVRYAISREGRSERGTQNNLSVLRRYMTINGVQFDLMQNNIVSMRCTEPLEDKPLEPATLEKMMDLGSVQAKAIISTLISTGMRAGECSNLLLSDVQGDTITIRNDIAKGKRGGKVYLTAEARGYIDAWLKDRDRHIKATEITTRNMDRIRKQNDQRLFACSYNSMQKLFSRLYQMADGEMGKYHALCTLHSTRRYFRTHAVSTMPLDLVEKIMRHTGYLTDSYVRISDEEARKQFRAGEAALYITRADHRIQGSKLDDLQRLNASLLERLQQLEKKQQTIEKLDTIQLSEADRDAIAKKLLALQNGQGKQ